MSVSWAVLISGTYSRIAPPRLPSLPGLPHSPARPDTGEGWRGSLISINVAAAATGHQVTAATGTAQERFSPTAGSGRIMGAGQRIVVSRAGRGIVVS